MKLALEALIDDADNDDDTANNTNDNNDAYDNNNEFGGVIVVVVVVGVIFNVLCFGSTGLYWSYLEGGPCKTEG